MIYTVPTKKGIGLELWGTYDDLINLYDVIGKFWNDEKFQNYKGYEDKNKLISGFSYEIRKAYEGSREKRNHSHYSLDEIPYLGTKFSWPHILFSISALRYNMNIVEINKFDIAMFLQLEYWIERSLNDYDIIGAKKLLPFIDDAIYAGNEYLYLFMRQINLQFFEMKGGKTSFRKLPDLMKMSVIFSKEYDAHTNFLKSEAKKYNCKIDDLELSDENEIYEIEW